jgi:alpha-maltose-1-phosphate synthase
VISTKDSRAATSGDALQGGANVKVALFTREFPPDVYGGAGVHVDFLTRELRHLVDLTVHAWGMDREGAKGHVAAPGLAGANAALQTLSIDLSMVAAAEGSDLAHSHTWYANMAGHLSKLLYDIPHVMTAHSLEPRRPWKVEQLKGGYTISTWAERTAIEAADVVIAVSKGMREDVLDCYPNVDPTKVQVVYNGIDTKLYSPDPSTDVITQYGVDPNRPYVLFIGRITRQKGVPHLVRAAKGFRPEAQVVLCAGAADTPELDAEFRSLVADLERERTGIIWISEMIPREHAVQMLSHATVFACPSVYEPLGIVNLEAMACKAPVVASAVGGIPEVVDDGVTGLLVPYDEKDPEGFERAFAEKVNELLDDPVRAKEMGEAGRERAVTQFGWEAIARETVEVYESVRSS